ncbi:MAG: ribosome biogenesis GTPase YlqF [Gallionellaceae bacterium]|nr:ribosome biogenesis GTPase YlqF [Gallionellaceae bacterium]
MSIQWFPGHMTSARKKATETMERIDVVIEVLDARLPEASCNPLIRELREHRQRPCLKILNKADLADPAATKAWLNFYNAQKGVKAVALSCKKAGDTARIPGLCAALAPHRGTNLKPLRMMIMGIPNVGKSTLMNALLKRRVALVGDEPAITKNQQSFDLNAQMTLIDTPGLMWPKIEHVSDGLMLAASHAIGRNAIIDEEVATFLGDLLLAHYPALLTARYGTLTPSTSTQQGVGRGCSTKGRQSTTQQAACGIDTKAAEAATTTHQGEGLGGGEHMDGADVIAAIAKRRGYLLKGGAPDLEKAALMLLQDYRTGALGRISLETPQSRSAMLYKKAHATEIPE